MIRNPLSKHAATLASRYEVEVIQHDLLGGWFARVYLVSKTTRRQLASIRRDTEPEARDAAHEYLMERPR